MQINQWVRLITGPFFGFKSIFFGVEKGDLRKLSSISSMNKDTTRTYSWLNMQLVKRYKLFGKSVTEKELTLEEIYGIASEKVRKFRGAS